MYTVYKTTNRLNGHFYLGVHKTTDPNDKYLGSGELIKQAIKKYGVENFKKEILDTFDEPKEAFKLEESLVAPHLSNSCCYNMRKGGEGGFDYVNRTGLNLKGGFRGKKHTPEARERIVAVCRANAEKLRGIPLPPHRIALQPRPKPGFHHSSTTKAKISASRKRLYGKA